MTTKPIGDKIIFETLNIMKYKSIGIVLAVIAGILIWQIISIAKTEPKSLIPPPETVAGGAQQPAGDVSVEVNYMAGKSDENKIVFEIILNIVVLPEPIGPIIPTLSPSIILKLTS